MTDDQKKYRKKKYFILSGVGVIALVIIGISAVIFSMSNKYDRTIFLKDSGRINTAAVLFDELGGFKDSKEQLEKIMGTD